jgi:signal transduction histidine kinase
MRQTLASSVPSRVAIILGCALVVAASSVVFAGLTSRSELLPVNIAAYSLSYLLAGSVAWLRRPANLVGPVMLATSVAGSLTLLSLSPDPVVARAAGVAGSLANVLIVWLMLAAPAGRLSAGPARWTLWGFTLVVIASSLVRDLVSLRVIWALGVVVSLLLAFVVGRRWVTASEASRRSLTPVVVAGIAISFVHAVDFASGVLLISVTPGGPIYWADTLSRILVPFGFLLGLLRLRLARAAVADLVVELGRAPPPERLQEALAHALRDPSLEVVYWSPELAAYVDPGGGPIDLDDDGGRRAVTYLTQGEQPTAAIIHDVALAEEPGLVAAVAAAVRLAVDNERLSASVRAQLDEVRASRARIVEASDAERRRVERNLHDGAQQRLIALSLALRRARSQLPDDAGPALTSTLDAANEHLVAALAELRQLASGIHPVILTEAGLEPALRALARDSVVPVEVRTELPGRLPEAVEVAAYFIVAEALANVAKYAQANRVEVLAEVVDDELHIEVVDDGRGGADPTKGTGLRGLADRVAALSGRLEVRSDAGHGTCIAARLPLASPTEDMS